MFSKRQYTEAIKGVSFDIKVGENVGLVGESGCGKSTLARAILALEKTNGGRISFDGKDISTLAKTDMAHLRRSMQVVFQDPYGSFNPRHKIGRLVAEPLHLLGTLSPADKKERVADVLDKVGLPKDTAHRYPHEFSGGQRQRIAIARSIITEPKLIVADEPVSALDVSVRSQVLDLMAELGERLSMSYLFISHDLHVVRAITDRVLVMKDGEILEQGRTEDVFRSPAHPYTKSLLAATLNLDTVLANRKRA